MLRQDLVIIIDRLRKEMDQVREPDEQFRQENPKLHVTVEEQAPTIDNSKAALAKYSNVFMNREGKRAVSSLTMTPTTLKTTATPSPQMMTPTKRRAGLLAERSDATKATSLPGAYPAASTRGNTFLEDRPDCGNDIGGVVEVVSWIIEEIPKPPPIESVQYNRYGYNCDGCELRVRATKEDFPAGDSFGVTNFSQPAHAWYEWRLPFQKVADRFDDLLGSEVSGFSACHCVNGWPGLGGESTSPSANRFLRPTWSTSTKPA